MEINGKKVKASLENCNLQGYSEKSQEKNRKLTEQSGAQSKTDGVAFSSISESIEQIESDIKFRILLVTSMIMHKV